MMFLGMTLFLVIHASFYLGFHFLPLTYLLLPLLLLLLPINFLYLLSLFNRLDGIKGLKRWILFLPATFALLAQLVEPVIAGQFHQDALQGSLIRSLFNLADGSGYFALLIVALILLILLAQIVIAALRVAGLLKNANEQLLQNQKAYAHINLRWVKIISINLLVFILSCTMAVFVLDTTEVYPAAIFNILVLISGGVAGFYAMKQDTMIQEVAGVGFSKIELLKEVPVVAIAPQTVVSDEEAAKVIEKIERIMQQHKPYLDKHYRISELSRQTEVKLHKLTTVIKDVMDTNFKSLINDYRIREAIHMLENGAHNYTIDMIADKSGFQSRSTFYACFKKYTGKTPKEFMAAKGVEAASLPA